MRRFLWRRRGAVGEPTWEPLMFSGPCFTCGDTVWVHPSRRDTSPLHPNPGGQWYCAVRCLDPDTDDDTPELDGDNE